MNYMERRGSGFKKIKEDYHTAVNYRPEVEPKFYSTATSFWVTLYNLNYNVQVEKDTVDSEKVAVEDKNVAIEDEKVAFAERLNETKFSAPTREKICRLFEEKGYTEIFGRTDISSLGGESLTAAGNLIRKMKAYELIEPIGGHGKGKYRFRKE